MSEEEPTEGRRVGVHPLIVVFGVIFGLWLFITLIIPKSKNIKAPGSGERQHRRSRALHSHPATSSLHSKP